MKAGDGFSRSKKTRVIAYLLTASVAAGTVAFVGPTASAASSTEIAGTLQVVGCSVPAAQIEIGALPLTVPTPADVVLDLPIRRAAVRETGSAGMYSFTLTGLTAGFPYLVAAKHTSRECRTRKGGGASQIVFAGSDVSLLMITLPATLDVYGKCPFPGGDVCTNEEENWRHTSYIIKTDVGAMARTFRSFAFNPQAQRARWEVARHPMSNACAPAPLRVASGVVDYGAALPAHGGPPGALRHVEFSIDFSADALKNQAMKATFGNGLTGTAVTTSGAKTMEQAVPRSGGLVAPIGAAEAAAGNAAKSQRKAIAKTVDPIYEETDMYFVRVVPIDGSGNCLGSASNRVAVQLKDPEPVTLPGPGLVEPEFAGHGPFTLGSSDYSITWYEATRPLNAAEVWAWAPVFDGAANLPQPGDFFYIIPGSSSCGFGCFLAEFGEGLWNAVADVVDWAATAWQDIKDWVVDQAAKIIDEWVPFINCDPNCRLGLRAGLDAALTAMGIPPSIPNFKQLIEQGEDYLIDKMIEEAHLENVPYARDEVERLIDDYLLPAAESTLSSQEKGGLGWAKPSSFQLPRPSTITVAVENVGKVTTPARVCANWSSVWENRCIWTSPLSPGERQTVTMALDAREIVLEKYSFGSQPRFIAPYKAEGFPPVYSYKVPKGCGKTRVDFQLTAWGTYSPGNSIAPTLSETGWVYCR
jgi:hypothetical protein